MTSVDGVRSVRPASAVIAERTPAGTPQVTFDRCIRGVLSSRLPHSCRRQRVVLNLRDGRRKTISRADQSLIAELSKRGITVSPTQLERWRQAGLQPPNRRRWLGRGSGSVSQYQPEAVDQAADLTKLVKRGRPLADVALIMFARGYWVREDALRRGYRETLSWLESLATSTASDADLFDAAEAFASKMLTQHRGGVPRLRRAVRAANTRAVHDRAAELARERADRHLRENVIRSGGGRLETAAASAQTKTPTPTREELAQAKAKCDSVEELLRTALQNLIYIVLAGKQTSDGALLELLWAGGLEPPKEGVEVFAEPLKALRVRSLKRHLEVVDVAELELARDQARDVIDSELRGLGQPADVAVAWGAIVITAIAPHLAVESTRCLRSSSRDVTLGIGRP